VIPDKWRDRRLGWVDLWMRATPDGNPYAHPVSGLKIIVDMNTLEVLEIEDHHDYGFPEVHGEYVPELAASRRGKTSRRCRSYSPRASRSGGRIPDPVAELGLPARVQLPRGPVIYQVGFDDAGTRREVAYRCRSPR
jgi:primary-amine oxidase